MLDRNLPNDKQEQDNSCNHLSKEAITALAEGILSGHNTYLLLLHLESCRECMDRYIEAISGVITETPPDDLNVKIIAGVKSVQKSSDSIQIVIVNVIKLGIAVCLTLLLFFSGTFELIGRSTETLVGFISIKNESAPPQDKPDNTWNRLTDGINAGFSDFAEHFNNLFKGEDYNG